jgi:hypothetical protein
MERKHVGSAGARKIGGAEGLGNSMEPRSTGFRSLYELHRKHDPEITHRVHDFTERETGTYRQSLRGPVVLDRGTIRGTRAQYASYSAPKILDSLVSSALMTKR